MLPDLHAEFERRVLIAVLQRHPEWLLGDLIDVLEGDGQRAEMLRTVTLAELRAGPPPPLRVCSRRDGELPIDVERKRRAGLMTGPGFDRIVLAVVTEAGRWVASGYVGERVGGPRWKLQGSLGRLVDAGELERRGRTSNTRYRRAGVWAS